ncbi:thi4 family protein [Mycobacterium kansasii]|uniref:Thi4 family protein n=1 Tax=Mycobacterium kansasii TaxID=1768 RepID=A0A1V3WC39_MYCKA|nr:thi4 family protein [Mycobacterium kansasii]
MRPVVGAGRGYSPASSNAGLRLHSAPLQQQRPLRHSDDRLASHRGLVVHIPLVEGGLMNGPTHGPTTAIETDYLVVGAGAMGIAFTDTLLAESEARVVIVDRAHQPGGHWTTAYPFVRLHQPSAYYGVNSRALGNNTIDAVGWNRGLNELASVGEICAYFDAVMQQQFLPSGRVEYFPMSDYLGDGRFRTLGGAECRVTVRRRIVDATYLQAVVPSMRPAPYSVAPGIDCIAPNDLAKFSARDRYVVVGAGKTGMDVCLWLLRNGVTPEKLTWIMPRDAWLIDRATLQPGRRSSSSSATATAPRSRPSATRHRSRTCSTGWRRPEPCSGSTPRCADHVSVRDRVTTRIRPIAPHRRHRQDGPCPTHRADASRARRRFNPLWSFGPVHRLHRRRSTAASGHTGFRRRPPHPAGGTGLSTGVQRGVHGARRTSLPRRCGEKRTLRTDSTSGLRPGLVTADAFRSA